MDTKYENSLGGCPRRTLWDFFLWKLGHYDDPIPRLSPPDAFIYPGSSPQFDPILPSVVWIGHSTFFIHTGEFTILTDPVWDTYCSPVPIKALKRTHAPPIALADLPKIDFVLISHNHYDHLDVKTVKHLHTFHPEIRWIVPLGVKKWFRARGISRVFELGWWKELCVQGASVAAVPAQHFSGRGIWDQNRTLWNGYVFEASNKRFYFTGDTGYNPTDFKKIGSLWPSIDLSLIPIGTYVPQKFMQHVHCSPREAVEIHCDVQSRLSIGMHWKTFCLSDEPMNRPPYDLYLAMRDKKLSCDTFLAIDPGIYINW